MFQDYVFWLVPPWTGTLHKTSCARRYSINLDHVSVVLTAVGPVVGTVPSSTHSLAFCADAKIQHSSGSRADVKKPANPTRNGVANACIMVHLAFVC